jgi:hypothetical protein
MSKYEELLAARARITAGYRRMLGERTPSVPPPPPAEPLRDTTQVAVRRQTLVDALEFIDGHRCCGTEPCRTELVAALGYDPADADADSRLAPDAL